MAEETCHKLRLLSSCSRASVAAYRTEGFLFTSDRDANNINAKRTLHCQGGTLLPEHV